ncbi:MAG: lytic transglycosylase domain-containing protein [Oscillospiraceae bacterium]|nr:lytic transglycosylase domain-containing protein [Oscillospiraceae bacterium]
MKQKSRRKKKNAPIILFLTAAFIVWLLFNIGDLSRRYIYPIKHQEYVELYSERNNLDKYLVYAVIKTESAFDENAVSNVGARGLMQLMEEAFDWVKFRMKDTREITYEDMFTPKYNIEYGTYLLMLLYEEYQDERTALAAYHSGRSNVNNWLKDKSYSSDGKTLKEIPSKATGHYVHKVMSAYEAYTKLYS